MKSEINKSGFVLFALVLAAGFFAAVVDARQSGSDVLAKLGLNPASAREGVLETLATGVAYNEAAIKAFKSMSPAARSAIVKSGLAWIKAYAQSAEFRAAYAMMREEEKPKPPEPVSSAEEQIKQQKAEFDKQVAEMRKNMEGADAATRKTMEEAIKQMQAQFAAMAKDPRQNELKGKMAEAERAENKERFDEQLKVWEEQFPGDPRLLIKKRIADFLETSADVDFAAKLVQRGGLMRFADPGYEEKNSDWKLCFRAGKEATEAARAFAKAWLAELEK